MLKCESHARWGPLTWRALAATTVLGTAWLALGALWPQALSGGGADSVGVSLDRPMAPANLAQVSASTACREEVLVLNSWEYTSSNPNGDASRDVLQALSQALESNQDAAQAFLDNNNSRAMSRDREASRDVLQAYAQLQEASRDTSRASPGVSAALAQDAAAMLAVYNKMQADLASGNRAALLQDTQNAVQIANKAVLDVSPAH